MKREAGIAGLTEELFGRVLLELEGWRDRERGETWALCESRRGRIKELLEEDDLVGFRKSVAEVG